MSEPRAHARFAATVLAAVGVQVAFSLAAPAVAIGPRVGFGLAFALAAATVLVVGGEAPTLSKRHAIWLLAPVALLALLAFYGRGLHPVAGAALVAAVLLAGGALAGALVGGHVQHAGHLLVVAWVSSLADVYSVLAPTGVSAQVVESEQAEQLLAVLALSYGLPGQDAIVPVLGIGDIVMVALYLSAARARDLSRPRAFAGLAAGFGAVLVALFVWERAIPALPFLGLGFVALSPETWKLPEGERLKAVIGMLAAAALFGWLFWR